MRIFEENQKFDQWWFVLLMLSMTFITIGSLFWSYAEVSEDEKVTFYAAGIPAAVVVLVITSLLFSVTLKTKIDEFGIHYAFWPFQRKLRVAAWHEIDHCNVRKYSPFSDYGGWGYKFSMKGRGKVYSTKGSMGIEILFKSGDKTMIGTQKPEEARQIIDRFTKNKNL